MGVYKSKNTTPLKKKLHSCAVLLKKKAFLNEACFTVPELYICLEGCHAALDAFIERHHGVLWGQLNTGRTDG